jgi:hypothetical protein
MLKQHQTRAAADGLTGWETLADNCHLYPELFTEEALAILDLLDVPTSSLRADLLQEQGPAAAQHAVTVLEELRPSCRLRPVAPSAGGRRTGISQLFRRERLVLGLPRL